MKTSTMVPSSSQIMFERNAEDPYSGASLSDRGRSFGGRGRCYRDWAEGRNSESERNDTTIAVNGNLLRGICARTDMNTFNYCLRRRQGNRYSALQEFHCRQKGNKCVIGRSTLGVLEYLRH